ncbi:MAG: dTDP-glucose 4,6-dehydratase [Candidatus Aphodousia sp.]|nr:dTDP-glucose 4,6-dehydratase [Sutterella sp.]MDY2899049.1 dTDP-glucose 4,6-dehydratase [Candidatus Aphodousia sp.]
MQSERVLVTGAAGFIGSHFTDAAVDSGAEVLSVDTLNYCGNLMNLAHVMDHPHHRFVKADVGDIATMSMLLREFKPSVVVHFAAQTHVDRSIDSPLSFLDNNTVATAHLMEAVRLYYATLGDDKARFRFIDVSTDEVYGDLDVNDPPFSVQSPFAPNSPYAASKAAADAFVRGYGQTYQLPVIIVHACNNYGPRQFPEKLIPLVIDRIRQGQSIPIYGTGENRRQWMYVLDHVEALMAIVKKGQAGAVYNITSGEEVTNLKLVRTLCALCDIVIAHPEGRSHAEKITFVKDRPAHDRRYAMDWHDMDDALGYRSRTRLIDGLQKTIDWYLNNPEWWVAVKSGEYRDWVKRYDKK